MDVLVIFFSAIFSQIPQEKRKKTRKKKKNMVKRGGGTVEPQGRDRWEP
jgi:preprotein translocase subunit YajC